MWLLVINEGLKFGFKNGGRYRSRYNHIEFMIWEKETENFSSSEEIDQLCDKIYKWFQRRKNIAATCHKTLDLLQVDSYVVPHSNVLPYSSRLV